MRIMFNEDRKKQFLEISVSRFDVSTINKYQNLFFSISESEIKLNKDFCDMNIPETKMAIISMGNINTSSISTIKSLLNDYNNWCISCGKTNKENSLLKIKNSDFNVSYQIKCMLLKSPSHLDNILQDAFKRDLTGSSFQSMLIAWLLYYGFTVNEIIYMKKSDAKNMESMLKYKQNIDFGEKKEVILTLLDICSKMDKLYVENTSGKVEVGVLEQSQYVLRGRNNSRAKDIMNPNLVYQRISDINTKYAESKEELIKLAAKRIFRSGIFYRLYLIEQSGNKLTKQIVYNLFDMDYVSKTAISDQVSKKIKDYENWKLAFEL